MNVRVGLIGEEIRRMKKISLIALAVLCGNFLSVSFFAFRNQMPGFITSYITYLLVAHMFYLILYLPISLSVAAERPRHGFQWPRTGWQILVAKYVSGVYYFSISLIITVCLGLISVLVVPEASITWSSYFPSGFYLYLHLLLVSTFGGAWMVFGWVLYHVLRSRSDFLAKLSMVGVVLFPIWLLVKWQDSSLFSFLFNWGPVQLSAAMPRGVTVVVFPTSYIGNYVLYLLLSILLFKVSGNLLDRKRDGGL